MLTRSKKTGFIIIKKYTIALENTEINVRKSKSVNPISKGTNLTFGWFSCFLGFFFSTCYIIFYTHRQYTSTHRSKIDFVCG